MDDVFTRILRNNKDNLSVILTSKNGKYIKSNLPLTKALEKFACVINFTDKVRVLMHKMFPDEEIEFIRIKGRKSNEIFVTHDDQLEIVVLQNLINGH